MTSKIPCLVTGGGGFVGKHIVRQLLDTNKYDVTVLDIAPCGIDGAKDVKADLRDLKQVKDAVAGKEVVFHVATAAPTGENALQKELMHSVNVVGTENVIKACQEEGVKKLIYTSSSSVVFEGQVMNGVDESHPYATKPYDYYTLTKIEGEKLILAANGKGGVATVALRPSAIFGEGDRLLVPTLVKQSKKGKMKYILGKGTNRLDFTYVGNVAHAHVLAADALTSPTSAPAGKPYFITNDEHPVFWSFMGDICEGLGYPRPHIHLPFLLVFILAFIFEYLIRPLLKPLVNLSSDFTVYRIMTVTRDRTFDCGAAKRDLGYAPRVDVKEGVRRTVESFQHLHKDREGEEKKAQ